MGAIGDFVHSRSSPENLGKGEEQKKELRRSSGKIKWGERARVRLGEKKTKRIAGGSCALGNEKT